MEREREPLDLSFSVFLSIVFTLHIETMSNASLSPVGWLHFWYFGLYDKIQFW